MTTPTLKVISGPATGQSLQIEDEIVIGREDADLTIPDPQLSRRHAAVRAAGQGVEVEDLGSSNGTFVDGKRISEPLLLTAGAIVRVGLSEIVIEVPVAAGTGAPDPGAGGAQRTRAAGVVPQDVAATPGPRPTRRAAASPPVSPPQAPPPEAGVPPPGPLRGGPRPSGRRPARRVMALLTLVAVAVIAAIVAAVVVVTGSSGSKTRPFDAQITTLPLASPTSVIVSGVLKDALLGRIAVIIQRNLDGTPRPGGKAVRLTGTMIVMPSGGGFGADLRGTLRATAAGGEVVTARGVVTKSGGAFEGAKGSFRLTGGRSSAQAKYGRFKVEGTLEY